MSFPHLPRRDLLVSTWAVALVLGLAPAHAQIVTRFTTYMHSGPGLQYSVTDEIQNRTPLAPESCRDGWCRIRYGGAFGYVQQNTLVSGPSTAQPPPGERPVECMDFARTGWPNSGDLERVCIFKPVGPTDIGKPAG